MHVSTYPSVSTLQVFHQGCKHFISHLRPSRRADVSVQLHIFIRERAGSNSGQVTDCPNLPRGSSSPFRVRVGALFGLDQEHFLPDNFQRHKETLTALFDDAVDTYSGSGRRMKY